MPLTYANFFWFTLLIWAPFRFALALMRTAKFSITRGHVSVVTLWVNDSTTCLSCLREQGFSLYSSTLAALQKKKSRGARVYAETIRALPANSKFRFQTMCANGP